LSLEKRTSRWMRKIRAVTSCRGYKRMTFGIASSKSARSGAYTCASSSALCSPYQALSCRCASSAMSRPARVPIPSNIRQFYPPGGRASPRRSSCAFEPLDPKGEDERSSGFVELENKNGTSFSAGALYEGEYALFAYRIDEVRVPAAAIRAEMDSWEQRFVAEHERPPVKKEKSEAKEELRFTLKTRYPVSSKTFEVSWHVEEGHAQIWAGSRKAVDEVQAAVEEALGVKLVPVAPLTIAGELGISEKALTPTAALSMDEEAAHGRA
jgi:recombination associated protein RdgC